MVTISPRFNGPTSTGNGGYVAGLVARESGAAGPVAVTLRLPPPLGTPLAWEHGESGLRLETHGGTVVAEAQAAAFDRSVPDRADLVDVTRGVAAFAGFTHHPFDTCFTCGTARETGDGLRIFAGPDGRGRHAATWTVEPGHAGPEGVELPVVWAALDCPGGWATGLDSTTLLLGRITAEVHRVPEVGEVCHVIAVAAGSAGRKRHASTALHTPDGELIGRSEQTWIAVDPPA